MYKMDGINKYIDRIHTRDIFRFLLRDNIMQTYTRLSYDLFKNPYIIPELNFDLDVCKFKILPKRWKLISEQLIPNQVILNNLDKPWDFQKLSYNHHITWDVIEAAIDKNWSWFEISRNPNITWEIVQDNLEKPWSYNGLSYNPNITWNVIKENTDKDWNWSVLLQHPNITQSIICNEFFKVSDNRPQEESLRNVLLSSNPNVTWEIIQNNLDIKWNWNEILCNPNITWEDINDDNFIIDVISLSSNPIITWEDVNDDKFIIDDMISLSSNPNVTIDIIRRNKNIKWDTYILANSNKFILQKNIFRMRYLKKWFVINKMKSLRANRVYDPNELLCNQRLCDFMNNN
jgi:hypothetical protein